MDLEQNTAKVTNPARQQARARLKAPEATLAAAERALGQHTTSTPSTDTNPAETSRMLKADLYAARNDTIAAREALGPIPAKLPANQLDPNAERATPKLAQRALRMVCRPLAYNAELDLARRLNTYLADPDEYRTSARDLLHQGGTITYQRRAITVTLDQPHPPRVARALAALIEELNTNPPHLPADRGLITYRLKA